MSPLLINTIGTAAALCSMASFAPQLVKIWREKQAGGISIRMYAVTATGFALWTTYGVFIGRWPIAASNVICLILSTAVLGLAIYFKRRRHAAPGDQG